MEQVHFSNEVSWILMTKLWICRVYGDGPKNLRLKIKILTGSQKHDPYRPAWTMWSDAENRCGTTGPKNYSGKKKLRKKKKNMTQPWLMCAQLIGDSVASRCSTHAAERMFAYLVPLSLSLPRFLDSRSSICFLSVAFSVLCTLTQEGSRPAKEQTSVQNWNIERMFTAGRSNCGW